MQVTLQINPEQLSETVGDLFKNLSEEQKMTIAADVYRGWLMDTPHAELAAYEMQTITKLSLKNPGQGVQDIRSSYDFKEEMKKFRSIKSEMMQAMIPEALNHMKKVVDTTIMDSPDMQEAVKVITEVMSSEFPKYVQQAVTNSFARNALQDVYDKLNTQHYELTNMEQAMKIVKERLGIY